MHLLNPNLVASGQRSLLLGAHHQSVNASRFGHLFHRLFTSKPDFRINFLDLFAVRPRYLHHHIDAFLLNDQLHELTGIELDLVGLLLPIRQFAFDGLARFKPADLIPVIDSTGRASWLLARLLSED
ncbi:MAG TPA: hypothetical protein VJ302_17475 [Blastocatellia bacterium]|nr:hypothetical protein [Blastocatellia bacterium]